MDPRMGVFILDNGAHSIKADWAATDSRGLSVLRNAVVRSPVDKRNYIADELEYCPDYSSLVFRLPFEKGILTNWEAQKTVWDRVFSEQVLGIDPPSTQLFITEPVYNLPSVQEGYDQMLFEEYGFASYLRAPGPCVVPFSDIAIQNGSVPECVLVIDAGYSCTSIIPILRGSVVSSGVRRIDVGGKLLTNYLKELISFRQVYLMDQTSVSEKIKEDCCYVTTEWAQDWDIANASVGNTIVQSYVLPDFVPSSFNKLGYIKLPPTGLTPPPPSPSPPPIEEQVDVKGKGKGKAVVKEVEEEQFVQMSNERFTIPEVMFNPSTIGLTQAGLSESIAHSIQALPAEIQGMFWSNIVCVGGSSGFPGFVSRLERELRSLAPEEYMVHVRQDESPKTTIALAASTAMQHSQLLRDSFVTIHDYNEMGSSATRRKFGRLYLSDTQVADELIL